MHFSAKEAFLLFWRHLLPLLDRAVFDLKRALSGGCEPQLKRRHKRHQYHEDRIFTTLGSAVSVAFPRFLGDHVVQHTLKLARDRALDGNRHEREDNSPTHRDNSNNSACSHFDGSGVWWR